MMKVIWMGGSVFSMLNQLTIPGHPLLPLSPDNSTTDCYKPDNLNVTTGGRLYPQLPPQNDLGKWLSVGTHSNSGSSNNDQNPSPKVPITNRSPTYQYNDRPQVAPPMYEPQCFVPNQHPRGPLHTTDTSSASIYRMRPMPYTTCIGPICSSVSQAGTIDTSSLWPLPIGGARRQYGAPQ